VTVTVIDLFAGAGGLSVGFERAGADVVCAVEASRDAAATYAANHTESVVIHEEIDEEWQLPDRFCNALDVLAGGPPCQGWSTLGHRGRPERRDKQRAAIGLFLRQVELVQPRAVLLENVRGLYVAEGGARVTEIETRLDQLGYVTAKALLRAAHYGIPQLRHRLFIVGIRSDLSRTYVFPTPSSEAPPTVRDAISDLPTLAAGGSAAEYCDAPRTDLQKRLRGETTKLLLHTAPAHPDSLLQLIRALPKEGGAIRDLPAHLRPKSGFYNTYARLRSDAPAPAVTSSIGRVSSGRHVHPTQDRALTPREAARLQTFVDDYVWEGGRWSIYEQIGNAVPPDLAAAVATPLVAMLGTLKQGEAQAA
jgi:DNA (cytosine-5)-methyltransferase 1